MSKWIKFKHQIKSMQNCRKCKVCQISYTLNIICLQYKNVYNMRMTHLVKWVLPCVCWHRTDRAMLTRVLPSAKQSAHILLLGFSITWSRIWNIIHIFSDLPTYNKVEVFFKRVSLFSLFVFFIFLKETLGSQYIYKSASAIFNAETVVS